jgi:uncharacterized protein (DUF2249 family)
MGADREDGEAVDLLGEQFCKALRALGRAGQPVLASHIAAKAWWATRYDAPGVAARINGTMHFLANLPDPDEPDQPEEPTVNDPQLDVRTEPPARRHDLILSTYHGLETGSGFVLVNDHDPKPLYYQFAAEYPEQFTWDYLESGPEVWKVRIGRPTAA